MDSFLTANRERNLWLKSAEGEIIYIPQGWCDEFSLSSGFAGGLDCPPEQGGPDVWCYVGHPPNLKSAVSEWWMRVDSLQKMEEITEAQARELHPALAQYLDNINQEA